MAQVSQGAVNGKEWQCPYKGHQVAHGLEVWVDMSPGILGEKQGVDAAPG